MKFKIDENLPVEIAEVFQLAGHDAITVVDQNLSGEDDAVVIDICSREERTLVTLDLDFADIRNYPPQKFPGIMVFRVQRQDKNLLVTILKRVIPMIESEPVKRHLWIIEETHVRIRGEEKGEFLDGK